MQRMFALALAACNVTGYSVGTLNGVPMPLSPADLTTYHLHHAPRFILLGTGDAPMLSLLPVMLIEIVTHHMADGSTRTVPVFEVPGSNEPHAIDPSAMLLEPYELPAVLRDLLWPPVSPPVAVAPVAPVADSANAGNIDDDPVPTGASDYDGPGF
jgi:hypothetical protein